jgi:alkyl hydroperoxide reductase subunit AhpF
MKDLLILGGGPAGAAAAVYASRKKITATIVTNEWGGQSTVSTDVQNWIGTPHIAGADIAKSLKAHVTEYASDVLEVIENDSVVSLKEIDGGFEATTQKGVALQGRTVLLCTGSSRRQLDVPGAERLNHKGISYCASCDAPLFGGVEVVVVGGGNAGFESAAQLLSYATKVTLLERGDAFKADSVTVEKTLANPKMEAITNASIKEIQGESFVEAVVYTDSEGNEHTIACGGVFVEIGSIPNSGFVKDLVDLNEIGEVVVDPKTQRASRAGIWAAGDVADGLFKQNNISMGDAVKALEDIYLYLQKM